jgi:hypothetical protein
VTTWQELAESAGSCTRCDLYQRATATGFGEGKTNAAMVLVGEQPGDQEDKQGRPFVGPAGRVLPDPGRQRHRPGRRLPDQRRQALQVDRARQAPDPPAPERHRDQGLQILAGGGTRFHPSPAARPARRGGRRGRVRLASRLGLDPLGNADRPSTRMWLANKPPLPPLPPILRSMRGAGLESGGGGNRRW